jgi:hypothetical protein
MAGAGGGLGMVVDCPNQCTCDMGQTCTFDCGMSGCEQAECLGGACNADCTGGNCALDNAPQPCSLTCQAGSQGTCTGNCTVQGC